MKRKRNSKKTEQILVDAQNHDQQQQQQQQEEGGDKGFTLVLWMNHSFSRIPLKEEFG
jgi:hypothetical protein